MAKHSGSIHKSLLLLSITFLLYSCTGQIVHEVENTVPNPALIETVFSGNFTTEEIRGLWYVCSVSVFSAESGYTDGTGNSVLRLLY